MRAFFRSSGNVVRPFSKRSIVLGEMPTLWAATSLGIFLKMRIFLRAMMSSVIIFFRNRDILILKVSFSIMYLLHFVFHSRAEDEVYKIDPKNIRIRALVQY